MNRLTAMEVLGTSLAAIAAFLIGLMFLPGGSTSSPTQPQIAMPKHAAPATAASQLPTQPADREPIAHALQLPQHLQRGKFQWRFLEGDTFYIEKATTLRQTSNSAGLALNRTQTMVLSCRVLPTSDAGETRLALRILGHKVVGKDPSAELGNLLAKGSKNMNLQVTLNQNDEVSELNGLVDEAARHTGDPELMREISRKMGVEAMWKEFLNRTFGFAPSQVVLPGDQWRRPVQFTYLCYGDLRGHSQYTHDGPGKDGEVISFTDIWKDEPPKDKSLFFGHTLKISKFKGEPAQGVLVFNVARGRLVRLESTIRLEITHESVPVDTNLKFEEKLSVRVLAENPMKE